MVDGFKEWDKNFTRNIEIVTKVNEKIFKQATQELYKKIVDRTPIGKPELWKFPAHKGYVPGTLKKSWTFQGDGKYAEIKNTVPYAYRVETGWSYIQAPEGMMRISALDWSQIVDKIAKDNKL